MKSTNSVLADVSLISKGCLLPRRAREISIIEKQSYQVVRGIMGKEGIQIFSEDREAILKALREGEVDHLELCTMTAMDEVVLFAHRTGFLSKLKEDFPETREKKKTPLI